MKTPRPPADTLRRVIKIARADGLSVLVVAGLGVLLAAALSDLGSVTTGLLVAGAGWGERHGAKLLARGHERGLKWLVRSQLWLLVVILAYALMRMASYDPEYVRSLITPEIRQLFQNNGMNVQDYLPMVRIAFYALYGLLAGISLLYQGGLALYYRNRAEAVRTALKEK